MDTPDSLYPGAAHEDAAESAVLRDRLARQGVLLQLAQRALEGPPLEVLLQEVLREAGQVLGASWAEVLEKPEAGLWPGNELFHATTPGIPGDTAWVALGTNGALEPLSGNGAAPPGPVLGLVLPVPAAGHPQPDLLLRLGWKAPYLPSAEDWSFLRGLQNLVVAAVRQTNSQREREARLRAEETLRDIQTAGQQRTVLLEAANRVALDIISSRMGVEALRHIAEAARVLAGARYAALGVASVDKPGLEQFLTSGLTPQEEQSIGKLPRGAGILGLLLQEDVPLRVDDLASHPASVGFPPNHPPMSSFLGVPIRRGGVALGSLYLTNKQGGGTFTEADEMAVSALGAYAAVAIHHLRLLSRQQDLTRSILTAQEEERRAVAHDLHDGLTQHVMAAYAQLEAYRRARGLGNLEKAHARADQGIQHLQEAVVESRRMINNLRLLVLDDLGLRGAIEQLLAEEGVRGNWEPSHLEGNVGDERYDSMLETALYRVAQETLTNARRHAHTDKVRVTLERQEREGQTLLCLEVRDWGKGFIFRDRFAAPGHYGLQGVAERIHLLNGTCEFLTAPGDGTLVRACVPVPTSVT